MKCINIEVSLRYKKSFRSLTPSVQRKAIAKIKIFRENPFHPQLKTHHLAGKERELGVLGRLFLSN